MYGRRRHYRRRYKRRYRRRITTDGLIIRAANAVARQATRQQQKVNAEHIKAALVGGVFTGTFKDNEALVNHIRTAANIKAGVDDNNTPLALSAAEQRHISGRSRVANVLQV